MHKCLTYPPGDILGPVSESQVELREGKPHHTIKIADTDLFYLGHWPHMHSSEMLMALATMAEHCLEEGEELVRVHSANFGSLVTSNLKLHASRKTPISPKALDLSGQRKLSGRFVTNTGVIVHILGVANDVPVEQHVGFNPFVPALSADFVSNTIDDGTLTFPMRAIEVTEDQAPHIGLATAHELLIRTWYRGLRKLLPNGGFAGSVNYSSIPTLNELATCDQLVLSSRDWEGRPFGSDWYKAVDVIFRFECNGTIICTGVYRHFHPNSEEDRVHYLRDAGIISS